MIGYFDDLLQFLGRCLAICFQVIPNYGMAIILLTVVVRLVMLPLTIKQTRSMQEMQKIQPELKKLQAKYKGGDRQKLNEEMMKLYKEHQVNPLGGCLPLLLQLPVFWALYRVLEGCLVKVSKKAVQGVHVAVFKVCPTNFVGVRYLPQGSGLRRAITSGHSGFLGINLGLSPVAALHTSGLVHAWPDYVLVFLMVATTWYQQKQIMAVSTGQQAAQMQMMGKIMPLILGVFSLSLPAGVSIYWVASNIWTIVQQRFVLGKTATSPATDAAVGPALADGSGASKAKADSTALPRSGARPGVKPGPTVASKPGVGAKPGVATKPGAGAKPGAKQAEAQPGRAAERTKAQLAEENAVKRAANAARREAERAAARARSNGDGAAVTELSGNGADAAAVPAAEDAAAVPMAGDGTATTEAIAAPVSEVVAAPVSEGAGKKATRPRVEAAKGSGSAKGSAGSAGGSKPDPAPPGRPRAAVGPSRSKNSASGPDAAGGANGEEATDAPKTAARPSGGPRPGAPAKPQSQGSNSARKKRR